MPTRPLVSHFAFHVSRFLPLLLLTTAASFSLAQETKPANQKLDDQIALITAAKSHFVLVDYDLQYDKGEPPRSTGFTDGDDHPESLDELIRQERPLEKPGVLLSNNTIVTIDIQINPRFIKHISIHPINDDPKNPGTPATIEAYPKTQNALLLKTRAELLRNPSLDFDPKKPGPYSVITPTLNDGQWIFALHPLGSEPYLSDTKKVTGSPAGLIIDKTGTPIAVTLGNDLPIDGSWKGDPLNWPAISAKDMAASLADLESGAAKNIVRVSLNFRSPKNLDQQTSYRSENDSANAAEQQVLGVLLDTNTILILADLKPKVTARLERIKVFTNPPIEAKFSASLTDYGAFVATLNQPTADPIHPSTQKIADLIESSLKSADILMQGEKRVAHFQPARFSGLSIGWRKNLYPDITGGGGTDKPIFLFDENNNLLALPIPRRQKASTEDRYNNDPQPITTPIAQLQLALANLPANSDPSNTPLTEEQENRIAWLGFELQPMNKELARANGVSDQTNDGESGALITYIYPDSPAAKANIDAGWVLLRINAQGQPKPIDIKIDNSADPFADRPFPWDRLGDAPESVFDKIPTPWPHVENTLTRTITDLGFGKTFTADFYHDGKIEQKSFTITQSPPYYQNAPKFKLDSLGLTVKNITYEVRRYMQKQPTDPGVVISKIEMGSKASSAGLKPYEVITHINDIPINNIADFENATKNQSDLRLSVKRMTRGRIVKITLTPNTQPATQP